MLFYINIKFFIKPILLCIHEKNAYLLVYIKNYMAKNRNTPRRENKKLPKHALEEIENYKNTVKTTNEFVRINKLDFELTSKQKTVLSILEKNKIITVAGPPGTSKTFIACYAATQALLAGKCKKIILSKPTEVLSGTRDPGALPGTLEEKMAVYAESFIDSFEEFLSPKDFKHLWDSKMIEFKPAQFLRGRSLKDSFIIVDEFQNFDIKALKSIVTRLGRNSKIVFMGDTRQNDINKKYVAVDIFSEIISTINGCENFKFEKEDIVREQILIDIIDRFEKFEDEDRMPGTIRNT